MTEPKAPFLNDDDRKSCEALDRFFSDYFRTIDASAFERYMMFKADDEKQFSMAVICEKMPSKLRNELYNLAKKGKPAVNIAKLEDKWKSDLQMTTKEICVSFSNICDKCYIDENKKKIKARLEILTKTLLKTGKENGIGEDIVRGWTAALMARLLIRFLDTHERWQFWSKLILKGIIGTGLYFVGLGALLDQIFDFFFHAPNSAIVVLDPTIFAVIKFIVVAIVLIALSYLIIHLLGLVLEWIAGFLRLALNQ